MILDIRFLTEFLKKIPGGLQQVYLEGTHDGREIIIKFGPESQARLPVHIRMKYDHSQGVQRLFKQLNKPTWDVTWDITDTPHY